MFKDNLLIVSTWRRILRTSRNKHNWKPCYVNSDPKLKNFSSKVFLHCVWEDTETNKTCYNVSEYPENIENSWCLNFLCYVKHAIKTKPKTIDNIETLNWVAHITEHSLKLQHARVSNYSKRFRLF